MKVAIVGSRDYPARRDVEAYVAALPANTVVVSGGARGVDTWAADAAIQRELTVVIIRADWERHGKAAGYLRNALVVEEADQVVAFWDGTSRGTKHTIELARESGKLAHIYLRQPVLSRTNEGPDAA